MTESEAVDLIKAYIESQFPKSCKCGRHFNSLRDYLQSTTHLGSPVSYDAAQGNWLPRNPIGTISLANCACGSTIGISTYKMGLLLMWRLMRWAKRETKKRNITTSELLTHLRTQIDQRVLQS